MHQAELELQNEELRNTQLDLQRTRERFTAMFEHAPIGYVVLDAAGMIRQTNSTWGDMLGCPDEKFRGKQFSDFIVNEDAPIFLSHFRAFFRQPAEKQIVVRIKRKNSASFYAQIEAKPQNLHLSDDTAASNDELMIIISDVTARKQDEQKIEYLNSLLKSVRDVNQLIVQESDLQNIMQGACDILKRTRDYRNIEISLLDETDGKIKPCANTGDYTLQEWQLSPEGKGNAPQCIKDCLRDKKTISIKNPETYCADCDYLEKDSEHNSIFIPVMQKKRLVGFLSVALRLEHQVSREEIDLLEEVAGNLWFAREKKHTDQVLAKSEKRFRQLFENISSGVAIYEARQNGEQFIFKQINHAVERIEQVNRDDIIGKSVTDVFPGVFEFGLFKVFQRVWRTGKPEHYPVSFYKDERIVGWRDNYVYKLPSGEIVAVYDDVTQRKQAEEALRDSEEKYRITLNSIGDAVIATDIKGRITHMNPMAENLTGWKSENAMGQDLRTVFHIQDAKTGELAENPVDQVIKSGKIVGLANHTQLVSKDGKSFQIADSGAPIKNEKGELTGVVLVFRDVTQEYQMREALKEREQRFRSVFESANVGKSITQPDGRMFFNKAFCDLLGYTEEELKNNTWQELTVEEDIEICSKLIAPLLDGKKDSTRFEKRFICKYGSMIWTDLSTVLYRDENGDPQYFITTVVDITERKKAEYELRKLKDNLEQEVERKTKELQERLRELERFHDATIEREFRMKELRDENDRLKRKLNEQ